MKKWISLLFIMSIVLTQPASALSYQYDKDGVAVPAPDGYTCTGQITGEEVTGEKWDPTDLFLDEDGFLNLLDAGEGNIRVFDADLNFIKTFTFSENGEPWFLTGASGLFVSGTGNDKTYFVTDPRNERVVVADGEGNIVRSITRPQTELIEAGMVFAPSKVLLDKNENLYVLIPGIYYGACVFSKKDDYRFLTFVGGNTVEPSFSVVMDRLWKQLLTRRQASNMKRYVPVEMANFTIDDEGYLYTVTNKSALGENFLDEIKKFNTAGQNILPNQNYGDDEIGWVAGNYNLQDTSFVDIAVSPSGNIVAADGNLSRIHVFDDRGNRLFVFGDRSNMLGSFDTISAVEVIGDDIYVLDQHFSSITRFSPTGYGKTLLEAVALYKNGQYEAAQPLWMEVLESNSGCILAQAGVGKALQQQGRHKEALQYLKLGNDVENYSAVFGLYRDTLLQTLFPLTFVLVAALFFFFIAYERRLKRKNRYLVNPIHKSFAGKITYTLFHPSEGGYVLARHTDKRKTMWFTLAVIGVWFVAASMKWQYSGFIFSQNNPDNFEVLVQLLKTAGLFILWNISALFVSNLMDSSARPSDISVVTTAALLPYIVGILLQTVLSNVLTLEDGMFLTVINIVLILWSVVILIGGLKEIHEFSFKTALLSIVFTLLGMAVIVFMLFLAFTLLQKMGIFIVQVFTEWIKIL